MCGNFSVNIEEDFYPRFKVKEKIKFSNPNIRPTSQAPIIMNEESGNHLKLAEWSLIPRESEAGKKYSTFNARFEGLLDSRLYHEPFKHTRCIVPMNNYFEWHKVDEKEKKDKYSISNSNKNMSVLLVYLKFGIFTEKKYYVLLSLLKMQILNFQKYMVECQ
jgi:putative SOS response-associated peptidase YedK